MSLRTRLPRQRRARSSRMQKARPRTRARAGRSTSYGRMQGRSPTRSPDCSRSSGRSRPAAREDPLGARELTEHQLFLLLIEVSLIVVAARAGGELALRLGIPQVAGEL